MKFKHSAPKELATRRQLMETLPHNIKFNKFIPSWDGVVVVTGSDRDTEQIFQEGTLAKLTERGFTPMMPPELKAHRTVICLRLDELIVDGFDPAEAKAEIERVNTWAKVQDVYKFPRSNTIKITFRQSEMAERAVRAGLLMYRLSILPEQVKEELYTPLTSCDKCYEVEDHYTQDCPKPAGFVLCSECSSTEHSYRACRVPASEKKCPNCSQCHGARAMRCPVRKNALRVKRRSYGRPGTIR